CLARLGRTFHARLVHVLVINNDHCCHYIPLQIPPHLLAVRVDDHASAHEQDGRCILLSIVQGGGGASGGESAWGAGAGSSQGRGAERHHHTRRDVVFILR